MSKSEIPASRRSLLAAIGLGGGAAVTLAVLPHQPTAASLAAKPEVSAKPEKGGGYVLSEHVKRYYKTTLV